MNNRSWAAGILWVAALALLAAGCATTVTCDNMAKHIAIHVPTDARAAPTE